MWILIKYSINVLMTTFLLIAICWAVACHSEEYWLWFWQKLFTYCNEESALLKRKCIFFCQVIYIIILWRTPWVFSITLNNKLQVSFFSELNASVERKLKKERARLHQMDPVIISWMILRCLSQLQIESN